ncbi:MAG: hypothetical protein IPN84_16335 [Sphingomonadales bacterium]|nr:hypothetical protein [Sphingomonadales bacterium]
MSVKPITVHIDVSVLTENSAVGRIFGDIDLSAIPQIGDFISFNYLGDDNFKYDVHLWSFQTVEHRVLNVNNYDSPISISLRDIVGEDRVSVLNISQDFCKKMNLFFDEY